MLAQIAPQVSVFSVLLLVICGILIGAAVTAWRSGDEEDLDRRVQSLREENDQLQARLRQQQELDRQRQKDPPTESEHSTSLRELAARLELFLRHRQTEHGSIEEGMRTLQQLVHATHKDVRAEREQRGEVARQLEATQAEFIVRQRELEAVCEERERLLSENLPAVEAEKQRLQQALTSQQQECERIAKERDIAVATLEEAGQAFVDVQRDVDSHRRTIDSIERQRGQAECELQTLQQQLTELREQARGKQELVARHEAIQRELEETRRQDAVLRAQLAQALQAQRHWQLELQTGNASAAADRQRLEQLEQQLIAAEQQSDRMWADRESMLESLRGAQSQNRALTQQLGDQEKHLQGLQDEVQMLRSLLEQRAAVPPATSLSSATTHEEANAQPADQVAELERQVEVLREQLRMAQVQAHELIQRQPAASEGPASDTTVRQLQQQVHQQSRAITQLERDRQELLARIQRQNQLLEGRAA